MLQMILFGKEILLAKLALMLLDLQMNAFTMINQRRIGFESRTAFRTKETFDIFMDGYFVDSKS